MPASPDIGRAFLDESRHQLTKSRGKIGHCLDQLTDEQMWWRPTESQNSIGNLILHLCGNVRQWIVSGVGGEPDTRDRPQEFSERTPLSREQLLGRLDDVLAAADSVLQEVEPEELLENRRIQGFDTCGLPAIYDAVAHFKGHTQEIICRTRMLLGDAYQFDWMPATAEEGAPSE